MPSQHSDGWADSGSPSAIASTPTVDLIDGERLSEFALEQELGVRLSPQVSESWFDRFD